MNIGRKPVQAKKLQIRFNKKSLAKWKNKQKELMIGLSAAVKGRTEMEMRNFMEKCRNLMRFVEFRWNRAEIGGGGSTKC